VSINESHQSTPWYVRIQNIPKPIIYLFLIAVLILPLFRPLRLPLALSEHTKKAYELVESLPEGSYVFHSVGILPASDAELWPQMLAMSRHYMEKGLRVIYWSYAQEGLMYADKIRTEIAPEYDYEYGEDYVILPFKAGQETAIVALKDFYAVFSVDGYGTPLNQLSMLNEFSGIEDLSLIVVNTGGDDVTYYIRHIEPLFNTPVIAAGTGPVLPVIGPFLGSRQVRGAVIGISGAAEYEMLADVPGTAIGAMDAQQLGHVVIVAMVLLGNIGYLFQRKFQDFRGLRGGNRG
jgi:hypothetical protein